jgi:hypothetical protein
MKTTKNFVQAKATRQKIIAFETMRANPAPPSQDLVTEFWQ